MNDLIKALQIFAKYKDVYEPTCCEHDILLVVGIQQHTVSADDAKALDDLGFFWSDEYDSWASFRFGSA